MIRPRPGKFLGSLRRKFYNDPGSHTPLKIDRALRGVTNVFSVLCMMSHHPPAHLWGRWFTIIERMNVPPHYWELPVYRAAIEEARELEAQMRKETGGAWTHSIDDHFPGLLPGCKERMDPEALLPRIPAAALNTHMNASGSLKN